MAKVLIERFLYSKMGTFGLLSIGNVPVCLTVERPWLNNQPRISCIPEGSYPLNIRESGVVSRTTKGRHKKGYEIQGVPDRTYIMMHVANTMLDLEGCVGIGKRLGWVSGRLAVTNSQITFDELMTALLPEESHEIEVTFNQQAELKYNK